MTKLDDLTIGEAKQLAALFGGNNNVAAQPTLNSMIGEKVIVRTYSAGVFFGTLAEKAGTEVILKDSRRLWQWWAAESISLSGVAVHGINQSKSKICPVVERQWLDAIEIIPCSKTAIKSIEGAKDVQAS